MNKLFILTVALVATVIVSINGEEIEIKGRLVTDGGFLHDWAKVRVDRGNTVRDLGVKICQKLEGQAPNKVKVRGHHDHFFWFDSNKSVEHEGLKHGDKVKVDCHP